MSEELTSECPHCDAERQFYLAASTNLHLGKKTKWYCPECDYGFVRIDHVLDTGAGADA